MIGKKYKHRIRCVKDSPHIAYCFYYSQESSVPGQGIKAQVSHVTLQKHAKVVPSQRPSTFPSIPQGSRESPNDRKQKSNELSKDIEQ